MRPTRKRRQRPKARRVRFYRPYVELLESRLAPGRVVELIDPITRLLPNAWGIPDDTGTLDLAIAGAFTDGSGAARWNPLSPVEAYFASLESSRSTTSLADPAERQPELASTPPAPPATAPGGTNSFGSGDAAADALGNPFHFQLTIDPFQSLEEVTTPRGTGGVGGLDLNLGGTGSGGAGGGGGGSSASGGAAPATTVAAGTPNA